MSTIGGFVLYGAFSTAGDNDGANPQISNVRAVPNPVVHGVPFTIFWTLINVPRIQITSDYGYDSGILVVNPNSSVTFNSGLSTVATHTFTFTAFDNDNLVIRVGGNPVIKQLLIDVL